MTEPVFVHNCSPKKRKFDEADLFSAFDTQDDKRTMLIALLYDRAANLYLIASKNNKLHLCCEKACTFKCNYIRVNCEAFVKNSDYILSVDTMTELRINNKTTVQTTTPKLPHFDKLKLDNLFFCSKHCVFHICTEATCCAPRETKDAFALCILTKQIFQDDTILSHGWIEDAWQREKPKQSLNEAEHKHAKHVYSFANMLGDFNCFLMGRIDQKALLHLTNYKSFVAQCIDELQLQLYARLYGKHYRIINKISSLSAQQKAWIAIDKYLRKCSTPIVFPQIISVFREAYLASTTDNQMTRVDPDQLYKTLLSMVTILVKYAVKLHLHTCLNVTVLLTLPIFLALIYVSSRSFKSDNIAIFQENLILQSMLPSANQLPLYGFNKTLFTYNKTLIRNAIQAAIHNGVPASVFILRF